MKNETLFRAVGGVGDDLVERAGAQAPQKASRARVWVKWTALAACAALVIFCAAVLSPVFRPKGSTAPSTQFSAAASTQTKELAPEQSAAAAAAPAPESADSASSGTSNSTTAAAGSAASGTSEFGPAAIVAFFDGESYIPAESSDPNLPADSALSSLAGEELGTVESGWGASDKVFAYGDLSPKDYILILHEGEYVLYRGGGLQ